MYLQISCRPRKRRLLPLLLAVVSKAKLPTQQEVLTQEQLKANKGFQQTLLLLRKPQDALLYRILVQLRLAQRGLYRLVVVIL